MLHPVVPTPATPIGKESCSGGHEQLSLCFTVRRERGRGAKLAFLSCLRDETWEVSGLQPNAKLNFEPRPEKGSQGRHRTSAGKKPNHLSR